MKMRHAMRCGVTLAVSAGMTPYVSIAQTSPAEPFAAPDFEQRVVAEGLALPTSLVFAPDGRLFIGEKNGVIRIFEGGALHELPFAEIEVYDYLECGLQSVALDPAFEQNHYVYVFATISDQEQQILRFTEVDGVATQRTVIRGFLPTAGTLHNGGGMRFGPDGKLYFSIGDTENPAAAQDLTSLAGKICRINPDGSTPDDNPFLTPTLVPRSAYALGFRNPFRFAFAPDGRLFVLDVGSDNEERREEINIVRRGDNCGWPLFEGTSTASAHAEFTQPIFEYHEGGSAPAGGLVYSGTQFPAEFVGNFFHVDYVSNYVYRVVLDGDAVARHEVFARGAGGPVDLAEAPDGSLYYAEIITGTLRQIRYVGGAGADGPGGDVDDVHGNANGQGGPVSDADDDGDPPPAPPLCGLGVPLALGTVSLTGLLRSMSRRRF